jgi:hypothetical protein
MIVMLQRKFSILFDFLLYCFSSIIYRSEDVAIQPYDKVPIFKSDNGAPINGPNQTDLYNAMIYPFTRTVIYGVIWYQGKTTQF